MSPARLAREPIMSPMSEYIDAAPKSCAIVPPKPSALTRALDFICVTALVKTSPKRAVTRSVATPTNLVLKERFVSSHIVALMCSGKPVFLIKDSNARVCNSLVCCNTSKV